MWWVCGVCVVCVVRAAEGEMQPGADRACPVCFCQCSAAAAGLKSRQDRSKARQGNERETLAAGPGGARWVCVGKAGSRSLGAWEPGGLGLGSWGLLCRRPHLRALWACAALLATRVVHCPESRESSAVQCGPVQQHTALPRLQRVAEHGGWCVFGCTHTVPRSASGPTGEPATWRTIPDRGPQVPGARGSGEEGREAKGTSRYRTEHRCTQRLVRPDRARCRS